jgi:hypothetical protein
MSARRPWSVAEDAATGIERGAVKLFLDPQQLVVFR